MQELPIGSELKKIYTAAGVDNVVPLESTLTSGFPGRAEIASLIINQHTGHDIGAGNNNSLSLCLCVLENVPIQDIQTLVDTQHSIDLDARLGTQISPVEAAFKTQCLDLLPILDRNSKRITARCVKEAALGGNEQYLAQALEKIPVETLDDLVVRKRLFVRLLPKATRQAIQLILKRWPQTIRVYEDEQGTVNREDISEDILVEIVNDKSSTLADKTNRINAIADNVVYGEGESAFAQHDKAYHAACRLGSTELTTLILSKGKVRDQQGVGLDLLVTLPATANDVILTQIARHLIPVHDEFALNLLVRRLFRAFRALLQERRVSITPDLLKAAAALPGVLERLVEILNEYYRAAIAQDQALVQEISATIGQVGAPPLLDALIDIINPAAVFFSLLVSDVDHEIRSAMYDTLLNRTTLDIADVLPACIDNPAPVAISRMRQHRPAAFRLAFNALYREQLKALMDRLFTPPRQLGLLTVLHEAGTGILDGQVKPLNKRLLAACTADDLAVFLFFVGIRHDLHFQGNRPIRFAMDSRSIQIYSYFVDNLLEQIRSLIVSDHHLLEWISPDPDHQDIACKLIPLSTEDQLEKAFRKARRVRANQAAEALEAAMQR